MHGRQLGRELGFPTANMEVADADTIESGVYESYVEIDGVEYKAMVELGMPFQDRWAEVPDISKPIFSTFRAISTVGDSGSSCGVRSGTSASSIRWRSCSARSNGIAAVF